jgi:hypothetical protein
MSGDHAAASAISTKTERTAYRLMVNSHPQDLLDESTNEAPCCANELGLNL